MPEERDPCQVESDFADLPEAHTLAQSMFALNQMLLSEYTKKLESDSWQVRAKSARGLGFLRGVAVPAIPALERLLADKDYRVRKAAALALASIRAASEGSDS
jgi:hypothetical protein